jgi:hypothetical protein
VSDDVRVTDVLAVIVIATHTGRLIEERVRVKPADLRRVGEAVQAKIDEVVPPKQEPSPEQRARDYLRSVIGSTIGDPAAELDVMVDRAVQLWRAGGMRRMMPGPHPPGPPAREKPPFDHPRADQIDREIYEAFLWWNT